MRHLVAASACRLALNLPGETSPFSLVEANDVWIADRNFCTFGLLSGIAERSAYFCVRQHANMTVVSSGTLRAAGGTETGRVFEQAVTITTAEGGTLKARRIVLRLDKPTRDGDTEMAILTNLPKSVADAVVEANLYRNRWTLETMFQSLTTMFQGEIATLGYPQAALFGFGVALQPFQGHLGSRDSRKKAWNRAC